MLLNPSDAVIRSFLLGTLPMDQREQLERAAMANPELVETIEAVEQDLIVDYLQNLLPEPDRRAFLDAYEGSTVRRARVDAVRTWLQALNSGGLPAEPAQPRPKPTPVEARDEPEAPPFFSRFSWLLAATAAIAVAVVGVWVAVSRPGPLRAVSHKASRPMVIATLRLEPGAERSAAGGSGVLPLPGSSGLVRFELQAAGAIAAETPLSAMWRRAESSREDPAEARRVSDRLVTVELPARVLARGDYVLRLIADGKTTAQYQFRVD